MNIDLSGRLAFVTGSGRGIGAATAHSLVAAGARVLVVDRKIDLAQETAAAIGAVAVELDITQEHKVRTTVASLEEQHGPIDILVNCAGILQDTVSPGNLSMETWDRITNVHQRGTYVVTTTVGQRMVARRRGSIVTIASTAGMRSAPLHAYSPAKAALISLTECLAVEWGRAGVRVNAVSPGFVPTPAVNLGLSKGVMDRNLMVEHSALGRLVEPSEVAAAVLFLVSDLASAVTGINLPVDAGWLVGTCWASYGGVRPLDNG
jgi:NAD(P)-dependent dehydrogenase (short-subunit alcohol dehydrogenase family)